MQSRFWGPRPVKVRRWIAAGMATVATSAVLAQGADLTALCGNPFVNHFGPFDYRTVNAETKKTVERIHFTPGIESMTSPKNTQFHEMAQDVEYTLNVFPNHHRALVTMSRLAERWKRDPPPGTQVSVECWFNRAVRFRPDDTVSRSLYAEYLGRKKRTREAAAQLEIAVTHAKDNPLSHYNIGLVYLGLELYDKALEQAHTALALGYPRQDLANKLKQLNRWTEPEPK